jgi:hypothetical protein
MAEPIYMRVGEGTTVELPELVGALGDFLGLLREVDSSVAEKRRGNLIWRVTTLERSPSPLVGVTPQMQRKAVNDTGERVERELIANVSAITDMGERTKLLSDAALNRVERIAKMAPKIGPSSIYTTTKSAVPLTTTVTVKTLTQIQDLTSVKSTSFGTVSGSLDSISVHRGLEFRVWDDQTNRRVRCIFEKKQESQAKDMLGKKVMVTGMVRADRYGRPIFMKVENFDPLIPRKDLPTIEEMRGLVPNFTGGLSLKEFFEDFD